MSDSAPGVDAASELVSAFRSRGSSLAVAESLTGGLLAAAVVAVPGASHVLRGGVVSYATDLKSALLGVDAVLLAEHGAVHPEVAVQMATGVRERLGADVGVATTGVAGPIPQDGQPVGRVFVAAAWHAAPPGAGLRTRVRELQLSGGRAMIREQAVHAALRLALCVVEPQ